MLVEKGKYVRIRKHLLLPEERLENIPASTRKVPLKAWIRGNLLEESELYEESKILTATGRVVEGTLKEVSPTYKHNFGEFVPEILQMKKTILTEFWGDDDE